MLFKKKPRGLSFKTDKHRKQKAIFREWLSAALLAIVAATLIRTFIVQLYIIPTPSMERTLLVGDCVMVSKLAYGVRMPITPLTMPLTHNTMPIIGTRSYLDWIQLPYMRFFAGQGIQRNDVVVFNYPIEYDRPIDKREHYIKRCVALPGDSLLIIDRRLFVNGIAAPNPEGIQFDYLVHTDGRPIPSPTLRELGIEAQKGDMFNEENTVVLPMDLNTLSRLRQLPNVRRVDTILHKRGTVLPFEQPVFPKETHLFPWNVDNYGSIYIPKKGKTISINTKNILLYKQIIENYEHNTLRIEADKIFINDQEANRYTFQLNYYFMVGDNRHDSLDSRYWGFVPEDHIVGKAKSVWFSIAEGDAPFWQRIRWNRIGNRIK